MLADWATEPELGPCDTPMEKLAHEIVKEYKDVYYAHRRVEADREAEKMVAEQALAVERQSLAKERAAREALAADLARQQEAWAAERVALLRDKEKAEASLETT